MSPLMLTLCLEELYGLFSLFRVTLKTIRTLSLLPFSVTSSEKVDKENRYSDFSILSLPYPGCEFFKEFRDLGYSGEGLHFNWSQAFVDAQLVIPERTLSARVAPDWNNYRVIKEIFMYC